MKIPTHMRLSREAKQLLKIISQKWGINETAIVEMAIRELAEKRGFTINQNVENCSASNV